MCNNIKNIRNSLYNINLFNNNNNFHDSSFINLIMSMVIITTITSHQAIKEEFLGLEPYQAALVLVASIQVILLEAQFLSN